MVYGLGAGDVTPGSNVLLLMRISYGIFVPMFPCFQFIRVF